MSEIAEAKQKEVAERAAKITYSEFWSEIERISDYSSSHIRSKLLDYLDAALKGEGDRQKQRLCFINKLPPELLTRILEDVMDLKRPENWSFRLLDEISSVQKSWKMVTRASTFWPTLRMGYPPELQALIRLRNPNVPLTIVANAYCSDAFEPTTMKEDLDMAAVYRSRWRGFHWNGHHTTWPEVEVQLAEPTPQLQDLRLEAWVYGEELEFVVLHRLSDGCHFRRVKVLAVQLPWHSARFQGLQSLYIWTAHSTALPSVTQIENMLKSSPLLAELILKSKDSSVEAYVDNNMDQVIDFIHLPLLIIIELHLGIKAETYLLKRIRSGRCQSLTAHVSGLNQIGEANCALSRTIAPILGEAHTLQLHYWKLPHAKMRLNTQYLAKGVFFWNDVYFPGLDLLLEQQNRPGQDPKSSVAGFIMSTCTKLKIITLNVIKTAEILAEPAGDLSDDAVVLGSDFKSFIQSLPEISIEIDSGGDVEYILPLEHFLSQLGRPFKRSADLVEMLQEANEAR